MLQTIGKIIVGAALFIGSVFGYHQEQSLGGYNPSGGSTYRLQSSIGSTDTSVSLSSFKEPISNIAYTMSYLNSSIEYGTLEPSNTTKKEFVSFTGITQNSDGTATLTGVIRGLSFSYPYTASTTLAQTHAGQSIFILSNTPTFYTEFATKQNNEAISGLWKFNSIPYSYDTATSTLQFATVGYANSLSIAGAPTSTEIIMGIVRLPTLTQMAAGTASSTSGAPLVIPTRVATNTVVTASGYVPTTDSTGRLPSIFISTSSIYTWSGSPFTISAATTTISSATTSIATTTNGQFPVFAIGTSSPSSILSNGGLFVGTSTYIAGGLGVGKATTSAGNISVSGDITASNMTLSGAASTSNIRVSPGSCSGCVKPTTVSNASGACGTNVGDVCTVTATCSGSQVVVGGGGLSSASSQIGTYENYPVSTVSWKFSTVNYAGGGAHTLTAYAICVDL